MINPNNKFALIIAYYLARFNQEALINLNFKNFNQAFKTIAQILGVKHNYIKLRRDEFDYIYPWRRGWQRPMHKQIIRTIDAFNDLEEKDLREIVLEILHKKDFFISEEGEVISSVFIENNNDKKKNKKKSVYILRGPTGKLAEEHFIKHFNENKFPVTGKLVDKREYGGGYDFEIITNESICYIEVKGMEDEYGGILLTNKEWQVAQEKKENFYLVIISSVKSNQKVKIINNPASILKPKKSIYTSIQIQWGVAKKQLEML